MKIRTALVRSLLLLPVAIVGGLAANIYIPRSIGEVRVDRVTTVPGEAMKRFGDEGYLRDGDRPVRMLRIELSSDIDLLARAIAVSNGGGNNQIDASSGPCASFDYDAGMSKTRGPYADDLPTFIGDYHIRHAARGRDNRYHYTVYVALGKEAQPSGDLCLKLQGSWYFSPHAESGLIVIPDSQIRQALVASQR